MALLVVAPRVLAVGIVDAGGGGGDGFGGLVVRRGRGCVRHGAAPLTLNEEQRAAVGVQQRADVLQDLVTQRSHVQLVADVFDLRKQLFRAKG